MVTREEFLSGVVVFCVFAIVGTAVLHAYLEWRDRP